MVSDKSTYDTFLASLIRIREDSLEYVRVVHIIAVQTLPLSGLGWFFVWLFPLALSLCIPWFVLYVLHVHCLFRLLHCVLCTPCTMMKSVVCKRETPSLAVNLIVKFLRSDVLNSPGSSTITSCVVPKNAAQLCEHFLLDEDPGWGMCW